jgi:hypothetical protein
MQISTIMIAALVFCTALIMGGLFISDINKAYNVQGEDYATYSQTGFNQMENLTTQMGDSVQGGTVSGSNTWGDIMNTVWITLKMTFALPSIINVMLNEISYNLLGGILPAPLIGAVIIIIAIVIIWSIVQMIPFVKSQ